MGDSGRRTQPERGRILSRTRILEVGLELADREGLDALTMRALAAALQTSPPGLYYHVADRDDLIDGIASLIAEGVDVPEAPDWETYTREWARTIFQLATDHPKIVPAVLTRQTPAATALATGPIAGLIERLVAAGMPSEQALLMATVIADWLLGMVVGRFVGRLAAGMDLIDADAELEAGVETLLSGIACQMPSTQTR